MPHKSRFGRDEWQMVHAFQTLIAPPYGASLETNDAVPEVLKELWTFRFMAPNIKGIVGKSLSPQSSQNKHTVALSTEIEPGDRGEENVISADMDGSTCLHYNEPGCYQKRYFL